jgi:hypothetical protein
VVGLPDDPRRETFDDLVTAILRENAATVDEARDLVAIRAGFSGWTALQSYLDVADVFRRDNDPQVATATIPDEFCRLACLTYVDDPPERRAAARELRGVHPELTAEHIWAAAAAADTDAISRLLAMDPALADADGGPYEWKPLHYLTYARHDPQIAEAEVIAAARLLLRAGADPNAGYLWRGLPTPFTALTGVFGEGEQGSGRCPRHPHATALATLLLDAGADPNDGQALYNRMFRPDDSHLTLLFSYGLGTGGGGPWRDRLGAIAQSPREIVDGQLDWAVTHGYTERVRLLIRHGADVRRVLRDGRTLAASAARTGQRRIVEMLVDAGADRPTLDGLEGFVAGCLAGDADAVARAPELMGAARAAHPALILRAVDAGRTDAVPLLVALGFDVNARSNGETALHWAAWNGDIAAARVLLDAGADPVAIDETFDATPLGWAEHGGQTEFIAFITPLIGVASPARS